MSSNNVLVLGAGNLGFAMAGHMALNGYNVNLGNRSRTHLEAVMANENKIELQGYCSGTGQLNFVGDCGSTKQLMHERDIVIITVPAVGQGFWVKEMLPYLKSNQHIVLHPGQLFGALEVKKIIMDSYNKNPKDASGVDRKLDQVTVSEIESALLTSRKEAGNLVNVFGIKAHLGLATLPASKCPTVIGMFQPLYKDVLFAHESVLVTELNDLQLMVHPIVTLLNTGHIDRGKLFLYYKEGVSEHVAKVIDAADKERMAIGRELGFELISCSDWIKLEYGPLGAKGDTLEQLFKSNPVYDTLKSPTKLYTRYIWEDIPFGLIGLIELGKQVGVATPVLESMYVLATTMFDTNWEEEARTLGTLGLNHLTAAELRHYAASGELPGSPSTSAASPTA